MTMESTVTGNFAKTSHALADKATDKVQAGIRSAQQSVQEAGDSLSSRVTDVHDRAIPIIRKTGARAQSTVQSSAPREALLRPMANFCRRTDGVRRLRG
jgi:hypothetical protein